MKDNKVSRGMLHKCLRQLKEPDYKPITFHATFTLKPSPLRCRCVIAKHAIIKCAETRSTATAKVAVNVGTLK